MHGNLSSAILQDNEFSIATRYATLHSRIAVLVTIPCYGVIASGEMVFYGSGLYCYNRFISAAALALRQNPENMRFEIEQMSFRWSFCISGAAV